MRCIVVRGNALPLLLSPPVQLPSGGRTHELSLGLCIKHQDGEHQHVEHQHVDGTPLTVSHEKATKAWRHQE